MLIKTTNLRRARFMDFYQVMSLVISFLTKEDLVALNLAQEAGEFQTCFNIFDKALKQAQKTGITADLIAADDKRDNIYIGFTGSARSLTRFPDAELAECATKILLITDKYGSDVARLPQREETAVLKNIIEELKSAENVPLLQKTGLTMWVDKLEEANTAFVNLYLGRNEKESEYVNGLTRTERDNLQKVFGNLVNAIEANAYLKGEAAYKSLADKINTEIANVQQAAKSRASLSAKAKPAK